MVLVIQPVKLVICICRMGAFQDLASTTALVKYVAEAHGDQLTSGMADVIFKGSH